MFNEVIQIVVMCIGCTCIQCFIIPFNGFQNFLLIVSCRVILYTEFPCGFLLWFFLLRLKKYLVGRSLFSTHRHLHLNIAALPFWSYIDFKSVLRFSYSFKTLSISGELNLLQIRRSSSSSRPLICDSFVFVNLALPLLNKIVVALISIFNISQSRRLSSKSE